MNTRRIRRGCLLTVPLLLLGLTTEAAAQPGFISTVAGTGTAGFNADGIPATTAQLFNPVRVFVDGSGNTFIADPSNHRLRKVDGASGLISTVAGTGTPGYNGEGIAATTADLASPTGVFVDGSGNIFIADNLNHRLRKVDSASGLISTVAGTGTPGFNGDGITATTARLSGPFGVFVDGSGNIFIADQFNHRLRKVDGATGLISTVAGTGVLGFNGDGIAATTAQLFEPVGVFVDGSGNTFIADPSNHRLRKVDGASGLISTVAGTGTGGYNGDGIPATTAQLASPTGVFVDGSGNIFIADNLNYRIRKVASSLPPPVNVLQDCWTTNLTLDPDPELELYTFTTTDPIDFIWKHKILETCSAYLASIWVFECLPGKPIPGPIVQVFHDISLGQQDPIPGTPEPLLSFSAPPGSIPPGRYDWALITECDDTNGRIAGAPVPDSDIDDSCGVNVGILPVFPGPVMLGPEPVELFDADPGGSPPGRGPGEEGTTRPWCFDVVEPPPPKIVFVTSQTFNGNLGGLAGADAKCNAAAMAATPSPLPGTYTAWLSDSSIDARDRVTQSAGPYVRTDGVRVAESFTDLTDCPAGVCLQAPINLDENNVTRDEVSTWTATGPDGALSVNMRGTCRDWIWPASIGLSKGGRRTH